MSDTALVTTTLDTLAPTVTVSADATELTCADTSIDISSTPAVQGTASYLWSNGATTQDIIVTTAGIYSVVVTDSDNGCSVTSVDVVITQDTNIPTAEAGLTGELTCVISTITLDGTGTTLGLDYLWTGLGTIIDETTLSPTVDTPGTLTLTVTNSSTGCVATDTVVITQDTTLPSPPAASSAIYCEGDIILNIVASGLAGSSFSWYSDSTLTVLVDSNDTFEPSGVFGIETVYVTQTNFNGCESLTTQVNITINSLPIVTFTAPAAIRLDAGIQTGLGGAKPIGGIYSGTGITDDGNGSTYSIDPLSVGVGTTTIIYTFTDANGCVNSASDEIQINALPTITVFTIQTCSADLLTYSVSVDVSADGVVTSTAGTVTDNGSDNWTIDNVTAGTDIIITVTDANSCDATLPISAPDCSCPAVAEPTSGGDVSYCEGSTIPTISATIDAGETVDWYDSSTGGTLLLGGNINFTPTALGIYYAEARDLTTSCLSLARKKITVIEDTLPLISSPSDIAQCGNEDFTITQTTTVGSGLWTLVSSTSIAPTLSDASGVLTVTGLPISTSAILCWTATNGTCEVSDDVTIENNDCGMIATKTITTAGSTLNNVIVYDIIVSNVGNVTLTSIEITDANADPGSITGSPIASLAPGSSFIVTAEQTIIQSDINAGFVENSAIAIGDSPSGTDDVTDVSDAGDETVETSNGDDTTDGESTNDPTVTILDQNPELTFTKTVAITTDIAPAGTSLGGELTFTFSVVNTGNVTVSNISIDDALTGTSGLAISPATLLPGEIGTVTVTYTIDQDDVDTGNIMNTATATGDGPSLTDDVSDVSDNGDETIDGPDTDTDPTNDSTVIK
jgi:uncharacterized repeat protein (TIGR01451 family)